MDFLGPVGGAAENLTQFEFLIQGHGPDVVILKGFSVHIVQQRPPLKGTHVPPSGAGGIEKRHLVVKVKSRPSVTPKPSDLDGEDWDFPL